MREGHRWIGTPDVLVSVAVGGYPVMLLGQ
jgi:hypothetical protein